MLKKIIRIAAIIAGIALIAWAIFYFKKPTPKEADVCGVVELSTSTVLPDPEQKFKTNDEITHALFDHYFNYYKGSTCMENSLQDSKLVSIDKMVSKDKDEFVACMTFSLKPTSLTQNGWATPETSLSADNWITNKKGQFHIYTATSTNTHYIMLNATPINCQK